MEEKKVLTPVKAIRAKCLDCCCGSAYEVSKCEIEDCSLFPYRFGKNPNFKAKELTDEERSELRERMRKINASNFNSNQSDQELA